MILSHLKKVEILLKIGLSFSKLRQNDLPIVKHWHCPLSLIKPFPVSPVYTEASFSLYCDITKAA